MNWKIQHEAQLLYCGQCAVSLQLSSDVLVLLDCGQGLHRRLSQLLQRQL